MEWNGMEWNGMEWNGMEWNGMEWNGMEWNGMEWNGMEWNGMEWNGMEWNGMSEPKAKIVKFTHTHAPEKRVRSVLFCLALKRCSNFLHQCFEIGGIGVRIRGELEKERTETNAQIHGSHFVALRMLPD